MFTPSEQQQAFFNWIETGSGNAILVAVAGSGKTTTLVKGCELMPGRVALAAYNKKIALELQARLEKAEIADCVAGTAHSFGFRAWRNANSTRKLVVDDKQKWFTICDGVKISGDTYKRNIPADFQGFVKKAVSLAKQDGAGIFWADADLIQWNRLVAHYDLEMELADANGGGEALARKMVEQAIAFSIGALRRGIELAREIIDFDDMIYMPLLAGCKFDQFDWILVDEAQDTNPVRRELYKRMLAPGGRYVAVGDPAQAIYGFTGASANALELIQKEMGCVELPLTTTFRCPKSVVRLAQTWVGHIQAHESNPEGEVRHLDMDTLMAQAGKFLGAEDAVLCRNTKPLVALAFSLIRRGVACHVEGREIGQGLLKLAKRWKSVKTLATLRDKLEDFKQSEMAKLEKKGNEYGAAAIEDKVETLFALIDSLPPAATVYDLQSKIEGMFSDSPDGRPAANLTLCTVHKSKGLEWDNVYLLGRGAYMPSRFARQAWQLEQEKNLCYVAVTRAKKVLTEVSV